LAERFSRREALGLGLSVGAATLLGRSGRWGAPQSAVAASCIARPEQTEGPYFVDERLNRSDIRSDPTDGSLRPGTKLALAFVVSRLEGSACVPLQKAVVDLWQCDAQGVYSGVQDFRSDMTGKRFLRGYQVTDASGGARFVTIWPGWYPGRTVHAHFKIRLDPEEKTGFEFTSQLYFDDALTDVVHARQPYAGRGAQRLRNSGDGIFRHGGDKLLLAPKAEGDSGYVARFEIALQM
jgi:protocatechuate 3,4-dioxygenase beta subunit